MKCCIVGCREYEALVWWDGEFWCERQFNAMQRQKCIDKGCNHPIPAKED